MYFFSSHTTFQLDYGLVMIKDLLLQRICTFYDIPAVKKIIPIWVLDTLLIKLYWTIYYTLLSFSLYDPKSYYPEKTGLLFENICFAYNKL